MQGGCRSSDGRGDGREPAVADGRMAWLVDLQNVVVLRGESALCYSEEEVRRCKQVLECEASREEELLEALRYLSTLVLRQSTLEETMIATDVKRLRNHPNANVARTARRLVDKWRQEILQASASNAKHAPEGQPRIAALFKRSHRTHQEQSHGR